MAAVHAAAFAAFVGRAGESRAAESVVALESGNAERFMAVAHDNIGSSQFG